jgi:hypothetical protein
VDEKNIIEMNVDGTKVRKNYIFGCKEFYIIATPHEILGGPIKH